VARIVREIGHRQKLALLYVDKSDASKKTEGWKIALELFETWVVLEESTLADEMLLLIEEVVVDALTEREWQLFVFRIIRKYLSGGSNGGGGGGDGNGAAAGAQQPNDFNQF
jgi:hypothetical protein